MAKGPRRTNPRRPHVQEAWEGGASPCKHNHFSPGVCELLILPANRDREAMAENRIYYSQDGGNGKGCVVGNGKDIGEASTDYTDQTDYWEPNL